MSKLFQKAVKSQSKLRCAIFGVSGSGKTYSSLAIASGLGNKIALIDSERGSAAKYASIFNFDVCNLENKTIEEYISVINGAQQEGYDVLIIDSISHAWDAVKEYVDNIQSTSRGFNGAQAWAKGTPLQNKFINSLLNYNGHVIATMRSKTAWEFSKDDNGKLKPVKIGLAPEQRSNVEYEFDLLMEMSADHLGTITKDRTGKFQDSVIKSPGKEFGGKLKDWLNEGEIVNPPNIKKDKEEIDQFVAEQINLKFDEFLQSFENSAKDQQKEVIIQYEKWAIGEAQNADNATKNALREFIKKIRDFNK